MRNNIFKGILFTILVALVSNISVSVSAKQLTKNEIQNNISSNLMNKELIKKADKYVSIKNGEFILDNRIYNEDIFSESEIQEIELNIVNSNIILKENNNKSVNNKEKSIEINFSTEQVKSAFIKAGVEINDISTTANRASGINRVDVYWWGYYIFLDSYFTEYGKYATEIALAGALSNLFPHLRITQALATIIISKKLWNLYWGKGCVISWNSALGYQSSWSQ